MRYFLLVISILCVGCSFRSKEMVAFDRVTSRVDRILAKEEGLEVFATGMLGPGYFKGIELGYVFPEKVERDEARRIFLRAMNTVLKVVNQDVDFVQYMKPPPFTADQLLFDISFNCDSTERYIGMIMLTRNKISYYLRNPETCKSTKIAIETLDEAIRILEAENMQLDFLKMYKDKGLSPE